MLFKEVIIIYYENHTRYISALDENIQSFSLFEQVVHLCDLKSQM
jgi:hypothetical protein